MDAGDPHIHVERKVVEAGADVRNLIASTFGQAADAPSVVTTGCGIDVAFAMTARRPEAVTCLACREHARREYGRFADQVERLGAMPGLTVTGAQIAAAVARLRDLAERYAG
ncbi:hypothetical protein [Nocardia sp. SSK8]|uniref:hypothetical protein n=1 Tax=Nocardia sp. SSK8 TaxID=3120154 RepID=UPI003008853B